MLRSGFGKPDKFRKFSLAFFQIWLNFSQLGGGGEGGKLDKIGVFIYSNFWQNLWKNEIEIQKNGQREFFKFIWHPKTLFVFFLAWKLTKP